MSAREIQGEKANAGEMCIQNRHLNAEASASALRGIETSSAAGRRDYSVDSPRIAFKEKGRILFLDLAEIVAVQAEGNYVSMRHRANSYLLRESLSSMAEKFKPYGFIRIHRSVIVNISAVEEIQPLPTGEYRLRVKGGKDYLVTRTYKNNLRDLAQLWLGRERLCAYWQPKVLR